MIEKILPLGTVVTLKNGDDDRLMIISRASIIEEQGEISYFDYGSVLVPQGMLAPEAVYFFNRENIKEVIFIGFQDNDEAEFEDNYDDIIMKGNVKKGSVD